MFRHFCNIFVLVTHHDKDKFNKRTVKKESSECNSESAIIQNTAQAQRQSFSFRLSYNVNLNQANHGTLNLRRIKFELDAKLTAGRIS